MANLRVNNYHDVRSFLNFDEYWDFYVSKDTSKRYFSQNDGISDKCLVSYIDLSDGQCIGENNWIYSKKEYYWDDAISIKNTLYNISFFGIDNGLFTYRKDRILNSDFLDILKKKHYDILDDDYRLKLHPVSGNTLVYDYPLSIGDGYARLNGGFFQGFFKTECDKYQVLPSKFDDGDVYHIELTMKKCDLDKESDKTLNDKYPSNKGIFFYIGTRAENKLIYLYDKDDKEGLESCEQFGIGDFVEGGDIDKKDYIIGNFTNVDPSFEEEDLDWTDFYLNYNYYDESLYEHDKCEFDDLSEYLDVEYNVKAKTIDEGEEHEVVSGWCQSSVQETEYYKNPCGCMSIRNTKRQTAYEDGLHGKDAFGEEYISSFDGVEDSVDCQDYIADDIDISDFEMETDNGFNMKDANLCYFKTDNKFLFFNNTCTGKTVHNWVEGTDFMFYGKKNKFKGNLFILMSNTCTGYNVSNIETLKSENENDYNVYDDLYDNALAFRITDEGQVGYRLLTKDCTISGDNKVSILEGYSFEGVIPSCEWFTVNVRINFLGGGKMKFMFYVNGKLVYITKELPRINLRGLDDLYEKQEGVPYNISIGGGSQGLCDTIQYNYMLEPSRTYPIEKHFGGSFIGYIKSFKIYGCTLDKNTIENNYLYDKKNSPLNG